MVLLNRTGGFGKTYITGGESRSNPHVFCVSHCSGLSLVYVLVGAMAGSKANRRQTPAGQYSRSSSTIIFMGYILF